MDKQQIDCFDALSADRCDSYEIFKKPSMQGIWKSIIDKYSQPAHFIYELLQNADDAKATSAHFELFADKLVFSHNGKLHFSVSSAATETQDKQNKTLGHINAITGVGLSTKTDDATIGKFGVGFKSVFSYTNTPHIYDPNFFFKIENYIVPVRLEQDYPERRHEETLFVFPFDHKIHRAEEAYSDISEMLRSLDYPLLFLSNLKHIEFEISGILGLYGKSIEERHDFNGTTAEYIRLTQNDGENREELYDDLLWLFSREDAQGHAYSVGFFVSKDGHLLPKTHSAFCFFPTKEVTGLNFIIHAPFLLTDSRETIPAGVQHNLDMISLLSELAADCLVYLRDIGQTKSVPLIDDNIFDIIPYDESGFGDVSSKKSISFKPFYTAIKRAFETEAILPTETGFVETKNAYWAFIPQITDLFSNEQLETLTRSDNACWVFTSFGRQDTLRKNKALTDYLDAITSVWLDESDILKGWSLEDGTDYGGVSAPFIEAQPLEWLHRFYKWIADTKGRTELILTKPIFLNQNRKAAAAFDAKKQPILFLPIDGGSGYDTVYETLLQNDDTMAFIKQIGVSEPSLRDEIYNIILPQYKAGVSLSTKPHFKKFFQYYLSCSQTAVKQFINLLRDYAFIICRRENDENLYRAAPSNLYLPFEPLTLWFASKPTTLFVCFDEYLELLGSDKKEELVRFFIDLGVRDVPRILSRQINRQEAQQMKANWPRSTGHAEWQENYLDGCKEIVEATITEQSAEKSYFLWAELLKLIEMGKVNSNPWSQDSILCGKYKYFYYSPRSENFESSEAKRLRTQPWLLNSEGEFVSASELTIQTLNSQYDKSCDEVLALFTILGIEEVEKIDDDADIGIYAESLGLSEEEQRQALLEYAKRKKTTADTTAVNGEEENESDHGETGDAFPINPSIQRVAKEISKRASAAPKEHREKQPDMADDIPTDEDDYTKPAIDISKKIEKVKAQAEQEVQEIARLEDLKQEAQEADRYSYAWFKALLELESMNSGENNANSREISISFAKVARESGTSRILVLKHPSRYVPQSMEDLADIPLELYFADQSMVQVAVEVVNVKSYTLRAKLRTNVRIDGVDLSLVTEARIVARNPVFLMEELRKSFIRLGDDNGYDDDFNMRDHLCENIEFVFGPPGTGKTTHVAKDIVLPMMKSSDELKVLVLTPTNKSADVLVRRLMESMGADQSYRNWLVRFGTTNDAAIERSGVLRDKTFDIRTFPRNVTVTTIARFPYDYFLPDGNTRLHLSALKWDYIIIDEASMIPIANMIYPLYKKTPKKFIIAGDPFQIEPITTVDIWKNENIYTMVKLQSFTEPTTVPHQYPVKLLTTQYRSIPEIGELFSRFAYGGVLKHFRSAQSQRQLPAGDFIDLKPLTIIKFPVSQFESIYRPKRLQSKTPYHVYSALFAFEFLKHLSEQFKNDEEFHIGLISPYRAQADLIDKLMTSISLPKNIDVQVGTIHGFQGDECDMVIALFNPPPSISTHKDMFLNKLNIVNVSISRARDYLIILMPDDETENVENLTRIKKVEQLCKEQPSWSEQLSPIVENVMFGSKTYIEDNSFSTSHQLVNVYGKAEKRYEIRSEDNAIDVQIHD